MRTTLNIEDGLLADAKELAAQRGTTVTAVVEEALRERVLRARETAPGPPAELPVFRGGLGFRAGVDLDDNAALLELMEAGLPLDKRR